VDRLAGPLAWVAACDAAGGAVRVGKAGRAVAGEQAVRGQGRQVQEVLMRAGPHHRSSRTLVIRRPFGSVSGWGCGAVGLSGRLTPSAPRRR
jgi:hypothetical protein